MQGCNKTVRALGDAHTVQAYSPVGVAQQPGVWVTHIERLPGNARVRHVVCGVYSAPFNQGGQRAIKQPLAIVTHGDFPCHQAAGGHAGCLQKRATVYALQCQSVDPAACMRHAGYKVMQSGPLAGQCALQI